MENGKTEEHQISSMVIEDDEEFEKLDLEEINMKITKIDSMLMSVDNRIEFHRKEMEKLNSIDERSSTRDKISRLTQRILENS